MIAESPYRTRTEREEAYAQRYWRMATRVMALDNERRRLLLALARARLIAGLGWTAAAVATLALVIAAVCR